MKHRSAHMVALLLCVLVLSCIYVRAQSGRAAQEKPDASSSSSTDERPASALYKEAEDYVSRKFDEFNRKQVPYNKEREARTYVEQQQMAARYAAILVARKNLAGDDIFYLAMLYHLAEEQDEALAAF